MANLGLSTTNGGGTQSTTQTPQSVTTSNFGGTSSGDLQPNASLNLLNSSNGILLNDSPVTTVNLNSTKSSATHINTSPTIHHINSLLIGMTTVLLVVAIVISAYFAKTANNTTKYS